MSSIVLDWYQQLLKDHLVITLFLTMLVGAGGNAGNQSAIKVIRGLVSPFLSTQAPHDYSLATQAAAAAAANSLSKQVSDSDLQQQAPAFTQLLSV